MNEQDYINGQLQTDVEHIKKAINNIACQPEKCAKDFITRKNLVIAIVCFGIGYGLITLADAVPW